MQSRFFVVFIILFFVFGASGAQDNSRNFSILFYNVENLFDTIDDPLTNDDDFTPDGDLHWTSKRLKTKLLNLSKVILSSGGWQTPDVIALCEVENRFVLEKLIRDTPLKPFPYKIIHKESPDHRGIDVAFLYNAETFYPLEYKHYSLGEDLKTREILYVSGILNDVDTVHFFVNHWPSRYSGFLETKSLRKLAAETVREKVDELNLKYRFPKIVIVGDFNDSPSDESITKSLKAKQVQDSALSSELYNLSYQWAEQGQGTMKYQSQWFVFDQIIVSGSLLNAANGYIAHPEDATIVDLPFLIERDERYAGTKPLRTYYGFKYQGGFSDHLPVLLNLQKLP